MNGDGDEGVDDGGSVDGVCGNKLKEVNINMKQGEEASKQCNGVGGGADSGGIGNSV